MYWGGDEDRNTDRAEDRDDGTERMTVQEAAAKLRVGEQAIRKRVKRGTIGFDKEPDGRVYVYLPRHDADRAAGGDEGRDADRDADRAGARQPGTGDDSGAREAHRRLLDEKDERIEDLRAQLAAEREARRRADHIIAALTERIPELEAPPQSAEEAESVAESASEDESSEEASEASAREPAQRGERTEAQDAGERRVPWWRRIFGG